MEQGQKIDKMDKDLFEANHQKTLAEDAFNERVIDINKLQEQYEYKEKKFQQMENEYLEVSRKMKMVDNDMYAQYQKEQKQI